MSTEDLESKILKQVEFYFSDHNLPKDKFLNAELKKNDGWVLIATIATFKRMRQLTEDMDTIVAALRKSPELLEVSEDGTKVRRKKELPEDLDLDPNSVYFKGFKQDDTLENIFDYLTTKAGLNVKCVRMRYYKDANGEKKFKGSIFAEFATPEEAKEACAEGKKYTYGAGEEAKELVVMSKIAYLESKESENRRRKRSDIEKDDNEEEKQEETKFEAGRLFKITNVGEGGTREIIKDWITQAGGSCAYVTFQVGDTEGTCRLSSDSADATTVVGKLRELAEAGKLKLGDATPAFEVLEGQAEIDAWKEIDAAKAEKRKAMSKRTGRGNLKRTRM